MSGWEGGTRMGRWDERVAKVIDIWPGLTPTRLK